MFYFQNFYIFEVLNIFLTNISEIIYFLIHSMCTEISLVFKKSVFFYFVQFYYLIVLGDLGYLYHDFIHQLKVL